MIRLIVPDSHGAHIDWEAANAMLRDVRALDVREIVLLGDHLDCGGILSSHARSYTNELTESYVDDCAAANEFLDGLQSACRHAEIHYIEGNHEQRVERWAAQENTSARDAENIVQRIGPIGMLDLKRRGIRYYRRSEFYHGLSIPGTIKLGRCFFTHGISHSRHADATHLQRFAANVVFGHVHRSMGRIERTVTSAGHGAWCPGTLAKLQPLYRHTVPTDWSHGYAIQDVLPSGLFEHRNVPIFTGSTIAAARAAEVPAEVEPPQTKKTSAAPKKEVEKRTTRGLADEGAAEKMRAHMQKKSRKLLKG